MTPGNESSPELLLDEDLLSVSNEPKNLCHERDFFRQEARVSAWSEYVLVSVLCTSVSFNALQSFQLQPGHQGIALFENFFVPFIKATAGFSSLNGIYATMVFALSILYCKTALGLEEDQEYDNFLQNTLVQRKQAFQSFSAGLGLFTILVIFIMAESLPTENLPLIGILLGTSVVYVLYKDWSVLYNAASPIFNNQEKGNRQGL